MAGVNFFESQRKAKGSTLKLVFLFIAAVIAMIAAIDGFAAFAMRSKNYDASSILGVVIILTAFTLLVIGGGMISKTLRLRQGGAAVAASVGAVPVDPTTSDPQLRRLVNIVEEMSLASGVPAPRLFVMPQEPGINAFAAGFTPADAAITVTSGALTQLNRDELQGVIGHEFSHILNGDMRLNIRLIGLLAGILLIAMIGLRLLQFGGGSRSNSKSASAILAIAIAMMVLGFIGTFFANLMKAAVSRQREWLADASAVQFTRQTDGLEGALKKIAGVPTGSKLRDSRSASEVSHMLFGEGKSSLFATHPPLLERIKSLDPSFDPREVAELQKQYAEQAPNGLAEDGVAAGVGATAGFAPAPAARSPGPVAPRVLAAGRRAVSPEQVSARAGTITPADLAYGAALHAELPAQVRQLAAQPSTAAAALIALLLAPDEGLRARQLSSVARRLGPIEAQGAAALAGRMAALPEQLRLPFVALAVPQLTFSPRDYQDQLRGALDDLAMADSTVSTFEYCVTRLVWSYLRDAADPSRRSKIGSGTLSQVRAAVTTLLATLAVASGGDEATARHAFETAVRRLYPDGAAPEQSRAGTWQARLDQGWIVLDGLEPNAKKALIEAMVVSVLDDGTVTTSEAELLRAACALMHVPLPALLA